MSKNNQKDDGPPYFRKETEDKYDESPDNFLLWAERELSMGNKDRALDFLKQAIEEEKKMINPHKVEIFEKYIEELENGQRISVMGDPQERWLPRGVPPPYQYAVRIDKLKERPEETHEKEKEILANLSQEREKIPIKELSELLDLNESDTIKVIKRYIHEGFIAAIVFESTGVVKFLKE